MFEKDGNQTRQQQKQELLLQLLQNYDEQPANDQLVVHLRLGDGLCCNWNIEKGSCTRPRPAEAGPIRDCWNNPADCFEYMDYAYANIACRVTTLSRRTRHPIVYRGRKLSFLECYNIHLYDKISVLKVKAMKSNVQKADCVH